MSGRVLADRPEPVRDLRESRAVREVEDHEVAGLVAQDVRRQRVEQLLHAWRVCDHRVQQLVVHHELHAAELRHEARLRTHLVLPATRQQADPPNQRRLPHGHWADHAQVH